MVQIYLLTPTNNSDAATKLYVDHKSTSQDLSPYIKKDGSVPMTRSLNMSGHKIINLGVLHINVGIDC